MSVEEHVRTDPPRSEQVDRARSARRRRLLVAGAIVLAVIVGIGTAVTVSLFSAEEPAAEATAPSDRPTQTPTSDTPEAEVSFPSPPALSPEQVAGLPAAVYDAVIPGLLAHRSTDVSEISQSFTIEADTPLFGDDHQTPVARIPASNFLGEPTIVVPVQLTEEWALVMTPSRQQLPSEAGGEAPAQTVGWVPRGALAVHQALDAHILISESAQTLTIVREGESTDFPIGVGTPETPTPKGTTGYIQARYDDPSQTEYTIQLTSLHATAADEPFGGQDGGLIGIHFNGTNTGAVSHGCIRLSLEALIAVNQLPLGTPLVVTD